jgi:hypothetical protein
MNDGKKFGFTTTIIHSDRQKPIEHGSLHKPIHTAVAYGYRDARELADVFQGKKPGYRYGRQGNPTVTALEEKITRMEEGVSTLCFATGMAAVGALMQGLLRAGDHVVSSAFLFGIFFSCNRHPAPGPERLGMRLEPRAEGLAVGFGAEDRGGGLGVRAHPELPSKNVVSRKLASTARPPNLGVGLLWLEDKRRVAALRKLRHGAGRANLAPVVRLHRTAERKHLFFFRKK